MARMERKTLDLNLLVALEALLRERSVTKAARSVGLSQPAMSRALERLREVLGDPLLVRVGHRMVLTERAGLLVERSERLAREVEELFSAPAAFDPGTSTRTFRLVASDYVQLQVLEAVQGLLAREAPRVALLVLPVSERPSVELLRSGEADLLLGPVPPEVPGTELHQVEIFADSFVGLARKGHPALRGGRLTLEAYASLSHVLVSPRGKGKGFMDMELEKHGLSRHVALTVPSFLLVPHVVAASDHVSVLTASVVATFCRLLPLRTFELPVPAPPSRVFLLWHERTHREPAHRWLRELLTRACRQRPSLATAG
jgi:DNA-binding transcriptional LysR family regulator